jgi:type II secretory ATPase GspE/PulE/Tfp pilus assembly ATPase PilB-like protein
VKPGREEKELLNRHGLSATRLFRGEGCDACDGTGFRGRTAITEAFASDESMEDLILKGARAAVITEYLKTKGFVSLLQHGLRKAIEGATTLAEVESAVVN